MRYAPILAWYVAGSCVRLMSATTKLAETDGLIVDLLPCVGSRSVISTRTLTPMLLCVFVKSKRVAAVNR
jgi:hypothetical protein